MYITEITRRDIIDGLSADGVRWHGRLEETEFLSRLYDLDRMPSTDSRFDSAVGDIWQHRVNNPNDWDDDWVFSDERFGLMRGDDEVLLRFLCETLHPVVRADITEAERLCQMYNQHLANDGFRLVERMRVSGRPIYIGRHVGLPVTPSIGAARQTLITADASYVAQQITRMEGALYNDPSLAIGTAKELIETCCKTILQERGVEIPRDAEIPRLVKLTSQELRLTPDAIPDAAKAAETIKRLLSNLATIAQGVAELRNAYGTGHGKHGTAKGLQLRHAKLAVGAASTLAVFLTETHLARDVKESSPSN